MIDLIILLAFVVYAISAGFYNQRKASKNLKEYFLAGHSLSGWKAGLSMAATQFAADTPLLVCGLIASGGLFLLWRLWIYGVAFLALAFIFSGKWRRSGVITDAEFTEIRYSGNAVPYLRLLKALYYGTVINCVVLGMVLVAAMRITEVFMPWHTWLPAQIYSYPLALVKWSNIIISSSSLLGLDPLLATTNNLMSIGLILMFSALYSTTGGLRGVVATDVMQFILAMLGTLVYAIVVLQKVGGFSGLREKLFSLYDHHTAIKMISFSPLGVGKGIIIPFVTIIGLQWLFQMNSDGTGYLAQRTMACRDDRQAKIAAIIFTWAQILFRSLIWIVIGVGLLVLYPFDISALESSQFITIRENYFVRGIQDFIPPGFKGLMLTGLLGALASTIDTHLNWGASYWSNDIYNNFLSKRVLKRTPTNKELVWVARCSNIFIILISITIMFNLGSIQQAWLISLLFGAGMGLVLMLRWPWERINVYSEMAAIVVSLIVAPIILFTVKMEWAQLGLMSLISSITIISVTLLTPKTDKEKLLSFYKRVRPCGFWKETAKLAKDDPQAILKKLYTNLTGIGLTASSLYCLLVGFGKLMIHAPGESILWGIIPVTIGLILIPFWWKNLGWN